MKLSDKILSLRKRNGLSQEELADKLNVSRQAVSRWEGGAAQPDASNVLQLSKLFGVTADYLLNDEYESDHDVPAVKNSETIANRKIKNVVALCISIFGLTGNFVIYILSRFTEVMVPRIIYENGKKMYQWSGEFMGRSYKYFIQEYNLEFLTVLFWTLFLAGLIYIFMNSGKIKKAFAKCKEKKQKAGAARQEK